MSRNRIRPRLCVEALEERRTPVLLGGIANPGGVLDPGPAFAPGAITFANHVITVTGTESHDIIRVEPYTPSNSQAFLVGGTTGPLGDSIKVTITDTAGVVRTDAAGQLLLRYFPVASVSRVDVRALGGDDRVTNSTIKPMNALGGTGNDTLTGGDGADVLHGEAGNEQAFGGGGNDLVTGGDGDDLLRGEAGDDVVDGGAGQDSVGGGTGNDSVSGGDGADQMSGDAGNDSLSGGAHDDILLGGDGNDLLRGDSGNDILSGGAGNDILYGGTGNDDLQGFSGNDGLFGGSGRDHLTGHGGIDRFLRWNSGNNETIVEDKADGESVTTFQDTTTQQVDPEDGPDLRYSPAGWTDAEIEAVDAGLAWLHAETGNTKMLRRANGGDMTMVRFGPYIPYDTTDGIGDDAAELQANLKGGGILATNHGDGTISWKKIDPSNRDGSIHTTIHELAHNWDKENPKYDEWLGLSGWVETNTPGAGQMLSADGKWAFSTSAVFATGYGQTNPREDFSTAFEAYYQMRTGTLIHPNLPGLMPKLDFIQSFVVSLM